MSLTIALFLSVLIQFTTAIIALSLVKRTKTNIAWWLISLGFVIMAIRQLFDLYQVFDKSNILINNTTNTWLAVFTSVIMFFSLGFIKRIFNVQDKINNIKKENEAKLFSAIIRTEEEQKQRFSKELHDGLGPLLSSVKMAISSIVKNNENEKDTKILLNTEYLIDESIKTVKEISNNLSPHILVDFGIVKALKSFINKLPENSKINIELYSNFKETRFEYNIETIIYRVLCELITNSLKHADAKNIFIDIILEGNTLNIKYLDDGNGFDYVEYDENTKGFGITNIKSRIKSVNGGCQIYSKKGEGFNANFVINIA